MSLLESFYVCINTYYDVYYLMTDSSLKAPSVISSTLFAVDSRVQICWAYAEAIYRGQTGIINEVTKKGGSGKNKLEPMFK